MCLQKARLKRDLITLLRKANALNNNQSPSNAAAAQLPQSGVKTEGNDDAKEAIKKDLESAVALATHCNDEPAATNVVKDRTSPSCEENKGGTYCGELSNIYFHVFKKLDNFHEYTATHRPFNIV